jgi:hypothetical protein
VVTAEYVVVVTSCVGCALAAVAVSVMVGAVPGAVAVAVVGTSLVAYVWVLNCV